MSDIVTQVTGLGGLSTTVQAVGTPVALRVQMQVASPVVVVHTGWRGARGLPGAAGGALVVAEAAANLSGHLVAVYDQAGRLAVASADDAAHVFRVAGITTGAASQGAAATVQKQDVIEHAGWTFAPGAPVFLGLAGALVQSLPPSALFAQVVGKALTATTLLVAIQPPVVLST